MLRKHIKVKKPETDKIRWRSHEPLRIEAFSDAVFAFAVSLLIISLEVPKTSAELLESMKGFLPFVCCFGLMFYIWFEQYVFFRRYGMHDHLTVLLNAIMMLVILFYIYPLKFLFGSLFFPHTITISEHDLCPLLLIYHGGFTCIYFLFALMYYNALKRKEHLELTPIEVFETRTSALIFMGISSVGVVLMLITLVSGKNAFISMPFYGLIGIVMSVLSGKRDKLFRKQFGDVPMVEPERNPEE